MSFFIGEFSGKCYNILVNIVGFVFTVYINRKRIYRGDNMVNTNKSSSHEQQKAEIIIAPMVENWLGCSAVRNAKVVLSDEYILSLICIRKRIRLFVRYMHT